MIDMRWKIETCEYHPETGVISVAHWRVSGIDGEHTASSYGSASLSPPPPDATFKPFAEVVEADVLKWIWGSVDKAETEETVAKQIEAQKQPERVAGTPWG